MAYTYEIIRDADPMSPLDWDEPGFLKCRGNRYFCPKIPEVFADHEDRRKEFEVYPLYAYIHGGVALSMSGFSDPWDSGRIGEVWVHKEGTGFRTGEKWREVAESMVRQWNMYLSGDVWGYRVLDEEGKEVDSCWGIYGREYAVAEAEGAASRKWEREREEKGKCERMVRL